jgi:hypothetical protein
MTVHRFLRQDRSISRSAIGRCDPPAISSSHAMSATRSLDSTRNSPPSKNDLLALWIGVRRRLVRMIRTSPSRARLILRAIARVLDLCDAAPTRPHSETPPSCLDD